MPANKRISRRSSALWLVAILALPFLFLTAAKANPVQASAKRRVLVKKVATSRKSAAKPSPGAGTKLLQVTTTIAPNPCDNGGTPRDWPEGKGCWPYIINYGDKVRPNWVGVSVKILQKEMYVPAGGTIKFKVEIEPKPVVPLRFGVWQVPESHSMPWDTDPVIFDTTVLDGSGEYQVVLPMDISNYSFGLQLINSAVPVSGSKIVMVFTRMS